MKSLSPILERTFFFYKFHYQIIFYFYIIALSAFLLSRDCGSGKSSLHASKETYSVSRNLSHSNQQFGYEKKDYSATCRCWSFVKTLILIFSPFLILESFSVAHEKTFCKRVEQCDLKMNCSFFPTIYFFSIKD